MLIVCCENLHSNFRTITKENEKPRTTIRCSIYERNMRYAWSSHRSKRSIKGYAATGHWAVIVFFCGRNGKFAAAKFAPFRNLLQIVLLFMKNLSIHHFNTEEFFFK